LAWTIKHSEIAVKQLQKLEFTISKRIIKYLKERIAIQDNPRVFGNGLLHDKAGLWRYRVEDYRIICSIQDHDLIVLVLRVGHQKEVK
jgi:mRNA interferase RelE/StbE